MNTSNRVLPFLEKTLSMRNGGNQFFMGDQVSKILKNVAISLAHRLIHIHRRGTEGNL